MDLGCGDTSALPLLLSQHVSTITHYTGVDASPQQLAAARPNLGALLAPSTSITLTEADIRSFVRTPTPRPYDTIFASFVVHHLPTAADKAALLMDMRRLLAPGGTLVMIDVVRRDSEDRESYMTRICKDIRTTWTALSAGEREEVVEHVTSSDYPGSWAELSAAATQAGYTDARMLALDANEMFGTMVFCN